MCLDNGPTLRPTLKKDLSQIRPVGVTYNKYYSYYFSVSSLNGRIVKIYSKAIQKKKKKI